MAFSITSTSTGSHEATNSNATLLDALSNFSISFWVKSSSSVAATRSLMFKESGGFNAGFYIQVNPSTSTFSVGKNNGSFQGNATASFCDGFWHNVIVAWDAAAVMAGYLDGSPLSFSGGAPGTPTTNANPFTLGAGLGSSALDAQFYDVRAYNITLTSGNATTITAGGGIGPTNLIAEWPFTEGSGTTFADLTGNGNTLTYSTTPTPFSNTDIPPVFLGISDKQKSSMFLVF